MHSFENVIWESKIAKKQLNFLFIKETLGVLSRRISTFWNIKKIVTRYVSTFNSISKKWWECTKRGERRKKQFQLKMYFLLKMKRIKQLECQVEDEQRMTAANQRLGLRIELLQRARNCQITAIFRFLFSVCPFQQRQEECTNGKTV